MKYAKKVLSLLLPLVMILAMVPAAALAADTITIRVRVYDETTYSAYVVGQDTVQKVDGQIQSQPYKIRPLSDFTDGTWKSISKVAGNWYFPSGDLNVGSNVYFSNNASTATITYWVRGFQESPSGGTTTPPSGGGQVGETTGDLWIWAQVVYKDASANLGYTYGDKVKVYLDCTSTYHDTYGHNSNCTIKLKDIHPDKLGFNIPEGYTWCGYSPYSVNLNVSNTFYSWLSATANVVNPSNCVFYFIYEGKNSGEEAEDITVTYHDGGLTAEQSGLAGDSFTILNHLDTAQDGREFRGWAETADAAQAQYTPGQQVTFDADTHLYAVWEQTAETEDWTIHFTSDLNDVTGLPGPQTVSHVVGSGAVTAALPEQEPKADLLYDFKGWSVQDGDGTLYTAGGSITLTQAETTLVAQWTALDVDGDGRWTYVDAMTIMDYLAGNATFTEDQRAAADYNGDGEVNYLDAMAIMDDLAGD